MKTQVTDLQEQFSQIKSFMQKQIVGQDDLIIRLLIAMLADGHLLVEGAPGLGKTRAIKELAHAIEGKFHRIQFTPDLLPGDLTGTDVYHPEDGTFVFQQGPLFNNMVLADEINRAPAKVQSALLEAMAERQITIGNKTYPLPELFLVMATQNPIEQDGTYPLPEAQLDRFLMYVKIHYPDANIEKIILNLSREESASSISSSSKDKPIHVSQKILFSSRQEVMKVHTSDALETYIIDLVLATRNPSKVNAKIAKFIRFGASSRATIALDRCSKAYAWLQNRDYVTPQDIQDLAHDVLRHRVLLTFEAEAEGISCDDVITEIINSVVIP